MNRILPPVRGLNIRVQWGMARVMRVIDPVKARGEEADALFEANRLAIRISVWGNSRLLTCLLTSLNW